MNPTQEGAVTDATPKVPASTPWPLFTRSGLAVDVERITAADVHWPDVSWSLSNLCRWNGHCTRFYSVAQHCCLAHDLLPKDQAVHGLLHDAHEAFVGDIVRPVKEAVGNYRVTSLQLQLDAAIYEAAGVDEPDEAAIEAVNRVDSMLLAAEARDLVAWSKAVQDWHAQRAESCRYVDEIKPWPRAKARREWTMRLRPLLA